MCVPQQGSDARREAIVRTLTTSDRPLSGNALSRMFGVTRQIIVGDMAILRASGTPILATPQGYVLDTAGSERRLRRVLALHHSNNPDAIRAELYTIVDHGCTVRDVTVEHPLYGEMTGSLQLRSRYDVEQFLERLAAAKAEPLLVLTEGFHLHTVEADTEEQLESMTRALRAQGCLVDVMR